MVMAPVGVPSAVMDTTPSFEDKIKFAFKNGTELHETIKLDGITYSFYGYARLDITTGSYYVHWYCQTLQKHAGQQDMIGYHDDYDFEDHARCGKCHPIDEEEYWENIKFSQSEEMRLYGVQWNPELTF